MQWARDAQVRGLQWRCSAPDATPGQAHQCQNAARQNAPGAPMGVLPRVGVGCARQSRWRGIQGVMGPLVPPGPASDPPGPRADRGQGRAR